MPRREIDVASCAPEHPVRRMKPASLLYSEEAMPPSRPAIVPPPVVVVFSRMHIAGPGRATAGPTDRGPRRPVGVTGAAGPGELLSRINRLVPLPLVRMQVDPGDWHSRYGSVSQAFRNDRAESSRRRTSPGRAAVNALEMRVGDRRIVATVGEREEARRVYEQRDEGGRPPSSSRGARTCSARRSRRSTRGDRRGSVIRGDGAADGEFSSRFVGLHAALRPRGRDRGDAAACDRANGLHRGDAPPHAGVRVRLGAAPLITSTRRPIGSRSSAGPRAPS
jgi:hypothetical protein